MKDSQPDLNPLDVILDFERATINAVRIVFKDSSIHGCFFHFCQNIWRHVQAVGLQSKYADDLNFAVNIRMLMALALVPTDNVVKAFETLIESPFWEDNQEDAFNKEKQALLNYFECTYIGKPGRTSNSKRHDPLFSIKLWNMYQVTLDGKLLKIIFELWRKFALSFLVYFAVNNLFIFFDFRPPTYQQLCRRLA